MRLPYFWFLTTRLSVYPTLAAFLLLILFAGASAAVTNTDAFRRQLRQADKLVKRGSFVEAERLLRSIIESNPLHSTAKLDLARLHLRQRRIVDAYDLSYKVAKAEPSNAYAFAVLGTTLLHAGKFPEARLMFFNALKLDRKQGLAWAGYGMVDFYENRIQESLLNLRQAVYFEPDEPDHIFAFAQVSARSERYNDAAEAYYRFLSISKNTDDERRLRIKGLINFLRFLGHKQALYITDGESATTVPFEIVGNRPIISLRVNGRREPLRFVLDTGSGISVISDKTAKLLGVGAITRGGYAKGIGGDGKFEIIYGFLRSVDIGEVNIRNVPVYIRTFHAEANQSIDGYIGLSLISKFLTTIDYGDRTFTLSKKDVPPNVEDGTKTVALPLRLTSSGFLSGEVKLEGIENPLNFIVDTGASVSVISDEVASLDAVSPFASGEKMRVIGSAGVTDGVASFLLPRLSFGSHSRESITAIALNLSMINEASGFEQAGILGGNFLRNYRMTFDFKNSKVTFTPIVID
jgi:tetratricopeptide (TPR) repeat protein